jgi:hypothetical protein
MPYFAPGQAIIFMSKQCWAPVAIDMFKAAGPQHRVCRMDALTEAEIFA